MMMSESFAVRDVPRFVAVIVCRSELQPFVLFQNEGRWDLLMGKDLVQAGEQMLPLPMLPLCPSVCFYSLTLCLSPAAGCNQSHSWNLARRPWLTLPPHFLCKLD